MGRWSKIRRDARRAAFAGASAEDEKALNPWKNRSAKHWGASVNAEEWEREFKRACNEADHAFMDTCEAKNVRDDMKQLEPTATLAVDLVISCWNSLKAANEYLFVRRKYEPYQGRLALPGGLVEEGETVEHAAMRELSEETGLSIPLRDLTPLGTWSNPLRDPRGRVVSFAFSCHVAEYVAVCAEAGSDAADVVWLTLPEIAAQHLAFDHREIIAAAREAEFRRDQWSEEERAHLAAKHKAAGSPPLELKRLPPVEGLTVQVSGDEIAPVTPSEALYGFAGWLTTRDEHVTFGSNRDASKPCELIAQYCREQGFAEPRYGIFPHNLKGMPSTKADKPARVTPLPLPDLAGLADLIELRRRTVDDIKPVLSYNAQWGCWQIIFTANYQQMAVPQSTMQLADLLRQLEGVRTLEAAKGRISEWA